MRGVGARAVRLAEAIVARYMPRTGWVSQAGLVYPAGRRPLTLALRLALTLLQWPGMPAGRRGRSASGSADPGGRGAGVPAARLPLLRLQPAGFRTPAVGSQAGLEAAPEEKGSGAGLQVRLPGPEFVPFAQAGARLALAGAPSALQRLARRGERVPMVSEARPGPLPVGAESTVPPAPRTVRQPRPDESDLEGAVQHGAQRLLDTHAQPVPWPALPGAVDMDNLDAFQVSRLAERVVQVIDDRIIARRERMGRV